MNLLQNLLIILQGLQSPTLSTQESPQTVAEKNAVWSPKGHLVPVEFKVCLRGFVLWSTGERFSLLTSSQDGPALQGMSVIRTLDAPSDSALVEREREEWEREQPRAPVRSQRSVSRERWVETMVVADAKLIEYHGSDNVEAYIFTIMNMASDGTLCVMCPYGGSGCAHE